VQCTQRYAVLAKDITSIAEGINQHQHTLTTIEQQLSDLRQEYSQVNQQFKDVETILNQEQKIAELSQYRDNLTPNEACPLCGSLDHPAVETYKSIEQNQTQIRFEQLKIQLEHIKNNGNAHKIEKAKIESLIEASQKEAEQKQAEQHALIEQWQQQQQAIELSCELSETQRIEQTVQHYEQTLQTISALVNHLNALTQSYNAVQTDLHGLEKQKIEGDNTLIAVEKQLTTYHENQAALQQQIQEQQKQVEHTQQQLTNDFNYLGIALPAFEQVESWLISQTEQVNTYQHHVAQITTLKEQISECDKHIAIVNTQQQQAQQELVQLATQLATLTDTYQQRLQERTSLFGEQSVSQVRTHLTEERKVDKNQLLELQTQHNNHVQKAQLIEGQYTASSEQESVLNIENTNAITAFTAAIQASMFDNEQAFKNALMSAEQRKQLVALKDEIQRDKQQSQTLINQHTQTLTALNNQKEQLVEKGINHFELAPIEAALTTLNQQLKQLQLNLGQKTEALTQNAARKEQQQKLFDEITQAQKIVDDLSHLNGLVGSADGSKFRRFAQGLTLAHLVYLANQQLVKLHGRYQLQRQEQDTLALEVIDTWQADVVRDTKTLSGGESFLVSLALALALSDLVSAKTSIDSLFLDEGFGTLDNDTLEIALDALDNLNASGKTIGVISHIETLKQRIAVQIEVKKMSGLGVSELDKQFKLVG